MRYVNGGLPGFAGRGLAVTPSRIATWGTECGLQTHTPIYLNRPGFDAASFFEEDADHAQALPRRAA